MKTFLVINANGEHIHTAREFQALFHAARRIRIASVHRDPAFHDAWCIAVAEAIGDIKSLPSFNIANNRGL